MRASHRTRASSRLGRGLDRRHHRGRHALTLSGATYITDYSDHPITAPLQGLASVFYLPRSIRPRQFYAGGDKPVITCSPAPPTAGRVHPDDPPAFDPQADLPGPVPLAVAIERGPIPGVH